MVEFVLLYSCKRMQTLKIKIKNGDITIANFHVSFSSLEIARNVMKAAMEYHSFTFPTIHTV
jgi:hypothetical protein